MTYQTLQLGDICEFVYGESLIESKREPGQIPVYGSNGIVGWHNQAITKGSAIIIGRKGSIGKVHFSSVPCYPIDTTYYINKTKIPCDLYWLYYILLALDLTNLNKSAAVPGLNRNDAYEKRILVPPLTEQKRIAAIALKADRLRRTRRYALQLSDTYLQSVFLEMFGDPVTNPKGWDVLEIGDICFKVTDGTHQPPPFTLSGIPFIFVQNIVNKKIDFSNTKYVSEATYQELTRNTKIELGDILYSSVGSFGVAVQVLTKQKFIFQRHIAHLKPNPKKINSSFLCIQLNSSYVYSQAKSAARGVAQPTVNLSEIREFKILVPPLPLQEKFAQIVQKFERLRTQQREAERQAEHLFQTILHRAFRGELTSSDINEEPADLLEQNPPKQTKPETTAKNPDSNVKQQYTEAIQLNLPGFE